MRTRPLSQLQYSQFLAASLAYLLSRQQDAVGLVGFDKKPLLPARNRTGRLRTICGQLSLMTAGSETDLALSLHQLAEILTRRGIVILISDFLRSAGSIAVGISTPAL